MIASGVHEYCIKIRCYSRANDWSQQNDCTIYTYVHVYCDSAVAIKTNSASLMLSATTVHFSPLYVIIYVMEQRHKCMTLRMRVNLNHREEVEKGYLVAMSLLGNLVQHK